MPPSKPIRFGTGNARVRDRESLLAAARQAEDLGFSTFSLADHFMIPLAPLVALQAVADATTTLRLGQMVLALGFRHPAVLAKELATLDVLSGGRVEVGIGAGWIGEEFAQAGMPFPSAGTRIEQLEEAIAVLKGLFADGPCTFAGQHYRISGLDGTPKPVQRPGPPILVGGGGPKLLAAAARQADIIQLLPAANRGPRSGDPWALTTASYREKIDWVRDAAGARFDGIELGVLLTEAVITDDPEPAEDAFLARHVPGGPVAGGPSRAELLASPAVAIGSVEQVSEKLLAIRDTLGISYFWGPVRGTPVGLAPVIERVAGR